MLIGFESPGDGLWFAAKATGSSGAGRESKEAVRRIQSAGIRVNGCFILGLDGQGPEIFDRVLEFAMETELFDVQITVQTPFPGTPLYSRLKHEGRLLRDEAWEMCTLFDINFRPEQMTPEELRARFHQPGHATLQRLS